MLDAINKIDLYMWNHNIDILETDGLRLDACLMQLIHIWEIMNKIIKHDTTFSLWTIESHRVIGLRNFAAHDYLGLNISVIQKIIQHNIPELKKAIEEYLK